MSEQAMAERFWEDLEIGHVEESGRAAVSKEEIIEFAAEFDPQPMHVDEVAAKATVFGGLIASGWMTMALCMRLLADGMLKGAASAGAPGVETLRWLEPVRPGDVLSVRSEILDKSVSRSRPELGYWHCRHEVLNQESAVVMRLEARFMIMRRRTETPA